MNVTLRTSAHEAKAGTAAQPLPSDHRLALLTARAGLEPELAQRYTSDPVSVLAEFGLPAMEPVFGDVHKNTTPGFTGRDLVIDHLDRPGTITLYGCATGMTPLPGEEAGAALA
ncbi:hypothetical protein [Streptomyces sp. NBC_01012]|uniref:hypothetical protein n=1 Tax=Streptomyces sp. NBC_01012 TaxID=2903717 RepID=UPI00386F4D76|nr:hypothetical protein OG623_10250 [Streptomyces sp. NBC_01012]